MLLFQLASLTAIAALVIELAIHFTTKEVGREFYSRGEDKEIAAIS